MVARRLDLLAIVGPTASGKTGLSIAIAKKYNGEIIAADSRTVYKYLDIGTAKPSKKEQQGIRHWGFDLVGPGESYSAAEFQKYAFNIIKDIKKRGKIPIIVGGSGLYIDSVLYNYSFAQPDVLQRHKLDSFTIPELQQLIIDKQLLMPENSQNKRYLIRTIERENTPITRQPLSNFTCVMGLQPSKEVLKERIETRAEQMLDDGVVEEIKRAYTLYPEDSEALRGGIYRSFLPFIYGTMSKSEAIAHFVKSDEQLAKRQRTWFRRNHDIHWFADTGSAEAWFNSQYGGTL